MPPNPLLARHDPIPFDAVRPEHVSTAVEAGVKRFEERLADIEQRPAGARTYRNTFLALAEAREELGRVWRPIEHLAMVAGTDAFRRAWGGAQPQLEAVGANLPFREALWDALRAVAEATDPDTLPPAHARHLCRTMQEFVSHGADLTGADRERAREIRTELAALSTRFDNHLIDATSEAWVTVTDASRLEGLDEELRERARQRRLFRVRWRFPLQGPVRMALLKHADDRSLRRDVWERHLRVAAEDPQDNRPVVARILSLRHELAELVGYDSPADMILEGRMARSCERALAFCEDLAARLRPLAERDRRRCERFAREELGIKHIEAWDRHYVRERMREQVLGLDEPTLRRHFALEDVLAGMAELCRRVFGVRIIERVGESRPPVWADGVRYFDVWAPDGTRTGGFYLDLFPRPNKRAGSWVAPLRTGGERPDGFEPHLAALSANLTPAGGDARVLLAPDEVTTLLHELGHVLHQTLSRVGVADRAGTQVARDFVELPSQLMEHFFWERPALDLLARDVDSGSPMEASTFEGLAKSRTFLRADRILRELGAAIVDLRLHHERPPAEASDVMARVESLLARYLHHPDHADGRMLCRFHHVFSQGYASAYYSYRWSEVLAADAFERWQGEGILSREVGDAFRQHILERGDAEAPELLYRRFRGRKADPEALTRRVRAGTAAPGEPEA